MVDTLSTACVYNNRYKFNSELHEYIKKAKMSNEKKTEEKSYPNTKFP